MKKLILAAILLMMVATMFVFSKAGVSSGPQKVSSAKQQELIHLAQQKYKEEKAKGTNMENGPCLGLIAIGWVVDVAHNPRTPIDDEIQNQCEAYRNGSVSNFIELDTNSNFIRTN